MAFTGSGLGLAAGDQRGSFTEQKQKTRTKKKEEPEFKPGDILFFLPPPEGLNCLQKMICCVQSLQSHAEGHVQITHSAIFAGYYGKENQPHIADVTAKGFRIAPLKNDQPILYYRARSPKLASGIAMAVEEVQTNELVSRKIKWDCCAGLSMFCCGNKNPAKAQPLAASVDADEFKMPVKPVIKINSKTVCSGFVMDVLKKAIYGLDSAEEQNKYDLGAGEWQLPHIAEAVLRENPNYSMRLSYDRNGKTAELSRASVQIVVEDQLDRMRENAKSTEEHREVVDAETAYQSALEALPRFQGTKIEKLLHFIELMEPHFGKEKSKNAQVGAKPLTAVKKKIFFFRGIDKALHRGLSVEATAQRDKCLEKKV